MDNSIIESLRVKGYEFDGNSAQGPFGMHYGIQSDEVSTWVYGHEISDLVAGLVTLKELAVRRAVEETER